MRNSLFLQRSFENPVGCPDTGWQTGVSRRTAATATSYEPVTGAALFPVAETVVRCGRPIKTSINNINCRHNPLRESCATTANPLTHPHRHRDRVSVFSSRTDADVRSHTRTHTHDDRDRTSLIGRREYQLANQPPGARTRPSRTIAAHLLRSTQRQQQQQHPLRKCCV